MSYKLYSDEEKKLQKKLIPLNLVVAIICLVAAVSLVITPLLKINIGKIAAAFDNEDSGEFAQYAAIGEAIDAEIEIEPLGMLKVFLAAEDEKGEAFLNEVLIKSGVMESVVVTFVNASLAIATREIDSLSELDLPELNETLLKVDGAKSLEEVQSVLEDYFTVLEGQLDFTMTEDMKESARDYTEEFYNTTVEATGGSFSLEEMICVNYSPAGNTYTSYKDILTAILNGEFDSSEEGSPLESVAQMLNKIAAPYGYAFFFVAFHVLMWGLLFLTAFFRMFTKNKRYSMWYVKLVSCWPCIIFWGLLSFGLSKFAGSISVIAPFAGVFAAFSSFTWISGICYLLLWLVSICWAFPIKHKIRKLRKGKA